MRRRRTATAPSSTSREAVYTCVLVGDVWHLTQEQATPPPVLAGGAWTLCGPWADFKRGYDKRRPTCPTCLRACERFERTSPEGTT